MKKTLLIMAVFSLVFSSCSYFTTTKNDPVIIPPTVESQLGLATVAQVEKEYKIITAGEIASYVSALGAKLAAKSSRDDVKFTFRTVDSAEVNAFAVPGGYIYVTTGLIKNMDDEAQLAAVIGHEIGHIALYHSVKQFQRIMIANYGLELFNATVLKNDEEGGIKAWTPVIANLGLNFLFLKNSRENEFEADEEGASIAAAAGYDPNAMVDVQNHLLQLRKTKPSQLEQLLSTHPISEERIQHAEAFIKVKGLKGTARNKSQYEKIKGAVK